MGLPSFNFVLFLIISSPLLVSAEQQHQRKKPHRLPNSPFPLSKDGVIADGEALWVLNITDAPSVSHRLLALSMVGIVAQQYRPVLATVDAEDADNVSEFHLKLLQPALNNGGGSFYTDDYELVMRKFQRLFRGYIRCDENIGSSLHAAISLAGISQALVVCNKEVEDFVMGHFFLSADVREVTTADQLETEIFDRSTKEFSDRFLFNQKPEKLVQMSDMAIYVGAFTMFDPKLRGSLGQKALKRLNSKGRQGKKQGGISYVLGWGDEFDFVSATSEYGHQVLCSDWGVNWPVYMNVVGPPTLDPEYTTTAKKKHKAQCPRTNPRDLTSSYINDNKHTITFTLTDGDSLAWLLGMFLSESKDWWRSPLRGKLSLAWTLQPALQEIHPWFLNYIVNQNNTGKDLFFTGPSGAGYTYLDLYPNSESRQIFADWTVDNVKRVQNMMTRGGSKSGEILGVINQIQAHAFRDDVEQELIKNGTISTVLVDEYTKLTIRGNARYVRNLSGEGKKNSTMIVSSRRHAISKTFGDLPPDKLVSLLNNDDGQNKAPATPTSTKGYSLVGVEVWGYTVKDIHSIVQHLNDDRVVVLPLDEYLACLEERPLKKTKGITEKESVA